MSTLDRLEVWSNREPILTVRRVVWVVTAGWWLCLAYLLASLLLVLSVVGAPFALATVAMAGLAFDGGITREPVAPEKPASIWHDARHPFVRAANVVWLSLFGWAFALAHLCAGCVQLLTIYGAATAVTQMKFAKFILWPFGRDIRRKELPTTLQELQAVGGGDLENCRRMEAGEEPRKVQPYTYVYTSSA